MAWLSTTRWVVVSVAKDPLAWLSGAILVSIWPFVAAFGPLGITVGTGASTTQLYELAFLSLLVGSMLATGAISRGEWFLAPLEPLRRTGLEIGAILITAGGWAGFVVGAAWTIGAPVDRALLGGAALSALHLAAASALILRLPLPGPVRALVLPLAVWVTPALLSGASDPIPVLARVLEAGQHLAFSLAGDSAPAQRDSAVLPIIGLALAATLLCRPNAIRHPR